MTTRYSNGPGPYDGDPTGGKQTVSYPGSYDGDPDDVRSVSGPGPDDSDPD